MDGGVLAAGKPFILLTVSTEDVRHASPLAPDRRRSRRLALDPARRRRRYAAPDRARSLAADQRLVRRRLRPRRLPAQPALRTHAIRSRIPHLARRPDRPPRVVLANW